MGYHVPPELLRRPGENLTAFVNRTRADRENNYAFLALAEYLRHSIIEGIKTIQVEYSGGDDEGHTDSIGYYTNSNKSIHDKNVIPKAINTTLDDIAWELVSEEHSGFWNNDGGHGHVKATYEENEGWTLEINHYDYVVNEEYNGSNITPGEEEIGLPDPSTQQALDNLLNDIDHCLTEDQPTTPASDA